MPADSPSRVADSDSVPAVLRSQPVEGLVGIRSPAAGCPSARRTPGPRLRRPAHRLVHRAGRGRCRRRRGNVAVEAELDVDPQRLARAGPRPAPRRPPGPARSTSRGAVDRVRGVRPAGDRPRLVALDLARPCASEWPRVRPLRTRRQPSDFGDLRRRFLFARFANATGTRIGDKIATSVAGKNLVTGSKFNFADIASGRLRGRGESRSHRRQRMRQFRFGGRLARIGPPPSRSFHPHQRRQPPGRRTPAMAEQGRRRRPCSAGRCRSP